MATSDVEICNLALTRIGHKTITSLTGGSSAGAPVALATGDIVSAQITYTKA